VAGVDRISYWLSHPPSSTFKSSQAGQEEGMGGSTNDCSEFKLSGVQLRATRRRDEGQGGKMTELEKEPPGKWLGTQ